VPQLGDRGTEGLRVPFAPRDCGLEDVVSVGGDLVPEDPRRACPDTVRFSRTATVGGDTRRDSTSSIAAHTSASRSYSAVVGAIVTTMTSAARSAPYTIPACSSSGGVSMQTISVDGVTMPFIRAWRLRTGRPVVGTDHPSASDQRSSDPCGSESIASTDFPAARNACAR